MKILLPLVLCVTAACQTPSNSEHDSGGSLGNAGIQQVESEFSFDETLRRLEGAISRRPLRIFDKIDHASGAASAGLDLAPTTLYIFGNPKGGTPLMQAEPTLALQLPLKMLVTDRAGVVTVSYLDMETVARSHGVHSDLPPLAKMKSVLRDLAAEASSD